MWPHSEEGWEPPPAHPNSFEPTANAYCSASHSIWLHQPLAAGAIVPRYPSCCHHFKDLSSLRRWLPRHSGSQILSAHLFCLHTCDLAVTSAVTSSSTSFSNHPSSSHCLLNGSHRHCPSTGWRATVQHRAWGLLQLFVITSLLNRLRRHGPPPVPFFASPCSFSSSRQKENFCSQKPLPRRYQNGMCFSTIDSNSWSW